MWRQRDGASSSKKRESRSENEGVVTFVRSCKPCHTIVTAVNIGYRSHRLCTTMAASASTYLWAEGGSCTGNEGVGKLLYHVFWAITHLAPLPNPVALLDHLAPCPCCVSLLALWFGGSRCVLRWRSDLRTWLGLGTSPGHQRVLAGIPVGILVGHMTHGSGSPVATGRRGSGYGFYGGGYPT